MTSVSKNVSFPTLLLSGGLVLLAGLSYGQGVFGKKKNQDSGFISQINAGLFPGSDTSSTPSAPAPSGGTIFKGGKPQEVKEVAYTIQNGQRVPAETQKERERGRLFHGILSREDRSEPTFNPAPPADAPAPLQAAAETSKKAEEAAPRERKINFPIPKLPILKKQDPDAPVQGTDILINEGSGLVPASDPVKENVPASSAPSLAASSSSSPAPVSKPVKDTSGTIIYNSWDEVKANKATVADRIVQDMRSQEAEQKRKMAEIQRQYDQQIAKAREEAKKAEEAAKMRAMLNGITQQPGAAIQPGGF